MESGRAKWICAKHGRLAPELLLEWLGITEPPVDPRVLADALDVILADDDLGKFASVLAMNDRHAGIIVSTSSGPILQRLAVAHCVGHLVLHEGGEFRDVAFGTDVPMEVEADLYAARLLMPAAWLTPRLARGDAVAVLAAAFGVSEAAMAARVRVVMPGGVGEG